MNNSKPPGGEHPEIDLARRAPGPNIEEALDEATGYGRPGPRGWAADIPSPLARPYLLQAIRAAEQDKNGRPEPSVEFTPSVPPGAWVIETEDIYTRLCARIETRRTRRSFKPSEILEDKRFDQAALIRVPKKRGRPPIGDHTMSNRERQARKYAKLRRSPPKPAYSATPPASPVPKRRRRIF
jgi:hypothetical protein